MTRPHPLTLIQGGQVKPKRSKPPKDYRAWLKAKGIKLVKIERTEKRKGEFEFDHLGRLVEIR